MKKGRRCGTLEQRFWRSVDKSGDCWLWKKAIDHRGYGAIGVGRKREGTAKILKAHRVSYEMHYGPIPPGMFVCHTCDTPPCVNPLHLFIGTPADNAADMAAKGRASRGEGRWKSKLKEDDVRAIRGSSETCAEMGRRYGVSQSVISAIRRRDQWKHVA